MARIRIGKPHVKPDASAHVAGVREGQSGPFEKQAGHLPDGRVTSRRSTGINPKKHEVIDPRMPSLPPS